MGHALMENRNGLLVDACLTWADGHAERIAALHMIEPRADWLQAITVGARLRSRHPPAGLTNGFVLPPSRSELGGGADASQQCLPTHREIRRTRAELVDRDLLGALSTRRSCRRSRPPPRLNNVILGVEIGLGYGESGDVPALVIATVGAVVCSAWVTAFEVPVPAALAPGPP